jgi:hypothetical protein
MGFLAHLVVGQGLEWRSAGFGVEVEVGRTGSGAWAARRAASSHDLALMAWAGVRGKTLRRG